MPHAAAPAFGAATLGSTADDIEPNTHILFRASVGRGDADQGGSVQAGEALELAMRITSYGGLLTELRRRPSDLDQAVHITAIMTIAQTVEMLFDQAQEAVGSRVISGEAPPQQSTYPLDPLTRWMGAEDEEVRMVGVPMLAAVLREAGALGDVDSTADQLWTSCGY